MEFKLNIFFSVWGRKCSLPLSLHPPSLPVATQEETIRKVVFQWIYNYNFGHDFIKWETISFRPRDLPRFCNLNCCLNVQHRHDVKSNVLWSSYPRKNYHTNLNGSWKLSRWKVLFLCSVSSKCEQETATEYPAHK